MKSSVLAATAIACVLTAGHWALAQNTPAGKVSPFRSL